MGFGKIVRVDSNNRSKGKKKVLSNKQLTVKYRALQGSNGIRRILPNSLANGVTLTAGTAVVVQLSDVLPETGGNMHYIDCYLKMLCSTAGGATVRLMFAIDHLQTATAPTSTMFLEDNTQSGSALQNDTIAHTGEYDHKNSNVAYRLQLLKDMVIALNNGEPKIVKFRIPLNNRKFKIDSDQGNHYPEIWYCVLADEANVVYSLNTDTVITVEN